ncbi:hypothetical protein CDIK_2543 [Cucumispora dikerogammari]|nr:hypothetical protein CDIK_2543 [Cucumispora dikerogammari]
MIVATQTKQLLQNWVFLLWAAPAKNLNLTIRKFLEQYSLIDLVNQLMIKISTPKKSAVLRKKTDLKPVTKNTTRWSSIFDMLERFIRIWEFIDVEDSDLVYFCHHIYN